MDNNKSLPFQLMPFQSVIHPAFWSVLNKFKLETLKLDQAPIPIHGFYVNNDPEGCPSSIHLDWDAFNLSKELDAISWNSCSLRGSIIIFNTYQAFSDFDKTAFLHQVDGKNLCDSIESEEALLHPEILSRFVLFMFADLKKYCYHYWFALTSINLPDWVRCAPPQALDQVYSAEMCQSLANAYSAWKKQHKLSSGYFCVSTNFNQIEPLQKVLEATEPYIIGFLDPGTDHQYPGWPIRNLIALLAKLIERKKLASTEISILCLRQKAARGGKISVGHSLILKVGFYVDQSLDNGAPFSIELNPCFHWEMNFSGDNEARMVNMAATMDPKILAETSVDMNLKLMKWRLVPDLNLNQISSIKCLLLGAGTLGCNVARCLLGWGVRHITLVDNAKVSYSNPVRQSLFTFAQCKDGGMNKAEAAAASLSDIFPGVRAVGVDVTVPLPAYRISPGLLDQTMKNFDTLLELISSHDVVFLLMDTRESRWLPTVMASCAGKLVINVALGFDSFLVMRHGVRKCDSSPPNDIPDLNDANTVSGSQLGCYFCTDVVAPGDSTKDRTLDQQCTVSRPGVSYQASGLAVELMASVLQHEAGAMASAPLRAQDQARQGLLGLVPHSIRGSIHTFDMIRMTSLSFSQCVACSPHVLDQFNQHKFNFFLRVTNDANYLKELTGLNHLLSDLKLDEVIACHVDEDLDDF